MHFLIHYYPGAALESSFVAELAEKQYKILHTLSVFFKNAGDILHPSTYEFYNVLKPRTSRVFSPRTLGY